MKKLFSVAILAAVLSTSCFAVDYDTSNQENDSVKTLKNLGFVNNKTLIINGDIADIVLNKDDFKKNYGMNQNVKNVKTFLYYIYYYLQAHADMSAIGRWYYLDDEMEKRCFLDDLDRACAQNQGDIKVDITMVGFNPASCNTTRKAQDKAQDVAKNVFPIIKVLLKKADRELEE